MSLVLINIFIFWLSFLPLVVWNGLYEGPKIIYFFVGVIFLAAFWVIRLIKFPESLRIHKKDFWYLGWLLVLALSSLFGIHPLESVIGGSYRHEGVVFFLGLWLVVKTLGLLSSKQKKLLIRGIAISVIVESAIVYLQTAGGNLYFDHPLGTVGEANAVAGVLAIGSFFILEAFPSVYLFIPFVSILLTESRSAILSFSLILSSFAKKFALLLIFMFSLLLIVLISREKPASVFENRLLIWKLGATQILQKPLLGFGAESGEVVYDIAFAKNEMPLVGSIVDRAHNLLIDVAMWSGLIGLFLFSGWLYFSYKNLGKTIRRFAFWSFLIFSMLQPLSVVHWILFIVMANI